MKKIAFRNFRRFQDFPLLELGKISITVGRNNSGKSTMVKAMLLVLDYLQNQQFNKFSFANKSLEDVNIVTFGRALNNKPEIKEISFQLEIDNFSFTIFIYGEKDDTNANVSKLIIQDYNFNIIFEINYNEQNITINQSKPKFKTRFDAIDDLLEEWREIEDEIKKPNFKKLSEEGLRMIHRYNTLGEKIDALNKKLKKENNNQDEELFNISYPLKLNLENTTEDTILQEFVSDLFFMNNAELKNLKELRNNYTNANVEDKEAIEKKIEELFANEDSIHFEEEGATDNEDNFQKLDNKIQELIDIANYKNEIEDSIGQAIKVINNTVIYYLGANPSKQSALFSIRDKQNNLAQAIHEFKQSKILKGESEYEFVKYWMNEFEVGSDFQIEFYAGEAYEFYVIDKEGLKTHLADKGMGSLQAMMLILRIATILRSQKGNTKNVTVIVEEPELNLHPALQGELVKFFHDVNKEYGIEFIIETHSEYLIRKSLNILVKEEYTNDEGLNPHPFKLYYFDIDNGPYEMKYQENGKFDRKFGKGFYDYSDELEVETYKYNLKKNK